MKNTVNVSELVIAHAYFIKFVLFIVLCFVMMGIFYVEICHVFGKDFLDSRRKADIWYMFKSNIYNIF